MTIGIYTDHFYPELGGIQDSIMELSRELGTRGHTIHIFAPRASVENFTHFGLEAKEIDLGANVHIHRLPAIGFPSSSMQSRLAIPFWNIPHIKLDIIHTHSFLGIGRLALREAKRQNIPIVGTNHWAIIEFADYVHWIFEGLFRMASIRYVTHYYSQCDFVSAPSQLVLHEKASRGMTSERKVISNPIDTIVFHPPSSEERAGARKALNIDGLLISCVGRIAPEKKNDIVVRAFAELAKDIPNVTLAFGGHGSFEPDMRALAKELGVENRIRFLGTLSKEKVAQLYHASDVYTIASVSETQSMSLIQAFSSGLPAVGVRWRAIPEYLNADRGFLFERDDFRGMAHHLETLLRTSGMRESMGTRARAFAEKFSIDAVTSEWENVYRTTIENSK